MATRELLSLSEPPVTPKKESPVNIENMTAGHSQIQSDREKTSGNNDTVLYTQGDHLSKLSSKLKAFREEGVMCDVNINLGVSSVLAHRCVLAAASPKLNSILADSHQALPLTQIDMPTKCPRSFRYVIDYLYTGCLSINVANIPDLIKLGDVLEIQEISLLCVRHLEESLNIESWSSIFNLAVELNINFILDLTKKFAVDYFSFLSSNNEFRELNYEHLTYLVLHCNAENDQDLEMFKIKEILQWVNHDIERVTYFESLIKYVNLHIIKPISLLETALSALILEAHVRDSAVYRAFCTELEVQKQQGSTDIAVNINDSEMGHKHLQCDLIQNVQMTDSPNLEQESDNETDCGEADDYMVKHNMDKGISTTSSKPKRIRSNIQLQNTEYDVEIAVAQTNKRKSFKPKRSVGVYKAKPTRANSSTRRSRGRPSKLTTSKHEKKPRMKTSCTQVISENIEEEFEEIAREEKDKDDQLVEYNQEDFPTKLETVDEIKLELEESKRTQIIQRVKICSKRPKPKVSLREQKRPLNDEYGSDTEIEAEYFEETLIPKRKRTKRALTEEDMFACMKCARKFLTRGALSHHMRGHGASAPLLCETCGFSTLHFATMNIHRRIHDVSLQYKCTWPGCPYSTIRKTRLNDHINSHSGIKNHVCSTCGKAYTGRKHLNRHEQSHNKDKVVKCDDCNYETARRDKLRDHVKRHHPGTAIVRGYMHPDDLNKPKPPAKKRPPRVRKPRPPKQPKAPPTSDEVKPNVIVERVFKEESLPNSYIEIENRNAVLHIAEESSIRKAPLYGGDITPTRDRAPPHVYHIAPHHIVSAGAISEDVLHLLHGTHPQGFSVPGHPLTSSPAAIVNLATSPMGAVSLAPSPVGAASLATSPTAAVNLATSQGHYAMNSNNPGEQQWYVMQYPQQ